MISERHFSPTPCKVNSVSAAFRAFSTPSQNSLLLLLILPNFLRAICSSPLQYLTPFIVTRRQSTYLLTSILQPPSLAPLHRHPHPNPKLTPHADFAISLVSPTFIGKTQIARHRMINTLLKEEFETLGLHTLSLRLKTPDEWEKEGGGGIS